MTVSYARRRELDDYRRLAGLILRAIAGAVGRRLIHLEERPPCR